ncbi:hypothetical protein BDZ91DRAFT_803845 [Kalaharituber pfeilii]|nr:hypothetical protein BDZ91DRAFT_803845 [Kalaharituber pfeilii]
MHFTLSRAIVGQEQAIDRHSAIFTDHKLNASHIFQADLAPYGYCLEHIIARDLPRDRSEILMEAGNLLAPSSAVHIRGDFKVPKLELVRVINHIYTEGSDYAELNRELPMTNYKESTFSTMAGQQDGYYNMAMDKRDNRLDQLAAALFAVAQPSCDIAVWNSTCSHDPQTYTSVCSSQSGLVN